ncbi:Por secretion system C-terminal sorting domain-containing protein [Mariniphaga anaerophila]|uniref:Por secretion system C-terminal sorting domain-containing protein n=1 Tax=Mariniphaga anaerophila TaxID=1484053 RepID=A0A1M4SLV5_9BACT|nr:T9SS type A sorting domain-containing protein [Mariniphaga anaerophila]SHE33200.1 Por secretion system C-terminal sorting domain-containing protein [Mariniphaga anaerophila]
MKRIFILYVFVFAANIVFSQQSGFSLLEYKPAPGQHINQQYVGTPAAAQKMAENFKSLVSLGSFGGYVILAFEEPCLNHSDNPYGIDFTVFGNAFPGSSEPGVVWVMHDTNKNGLPDDTWYEIAGSSYFHSQTINNYEVTYSRTDGRDILWKDNLDNTGRILAISYNTQDYYPTTDIFPEYPQAEVVFGGTLLATEIDSSNVQEIKVLAPAFGYADNRPQKQGAELFVPDNPYTKEIEGAGGDPVDISWAVDKQGNYVHLDAIHFVKIVSANLANAGRLGEVSTDVSWVEAVLPQPGVSGKENLLVVFPHPAKMLLNNSFKLETAYFEKGRKTDAAFSFQSQNEEIIQATADGRIIAESLGNTEIVVAANDETDTLTLKVVRPEAIQLLTDFSSVYPGDTLILNARVIDNEQGKLDVPVNFVLSDNTVGNIFTKNGKAYFAASSPGETIVSCSVEGFSVKEDLTVKVHSPEDKMRVYFTLKTETENVLPRQWIEVGAADLNSMIENRQSDYSGIERPVLFNAIIAGLQKANVPFVFKDDDAADGKLYLFSLENDGLFSNGWGGKLEPSAYARAWVARLNGKQYLNNFHQHEISDGDTVDLYHVSDISNSWIYSCLTSNNDSAKIGDVITVLLEQAACQYVNGEITASEFAPVANAEITAEKTLYTNEQGEAAFVLEAEPPLVVYSDNNAVLISKKITTESNFIANRKYRVYPNPVKKELVIEGFSGDGKLKLFSPSGQLVAEKSAHSGPVWFDTSLLPQGIYLLVIVHENKTETHKIIKR